MAMARTAARTAIITGASRGLGLSLARSLAERGWTLVLDARSEAALRAAADELAPLTKVSAVAGDVTDPNHVDELVAAAAGLGGGRLDLLVNNASLLGPSPQPRLAEYPLDVLEMVYRVNLIAP